MGLHQAVNKQKIVVKSERQRLLHNELVLLVARKKQRQ